MEKTTPRQNRVREALERIYDKHPPHFAEYLRRFKEDPKSRVFAPLAEAYRRLGRIDDALIICQQGLAHHPDFHGGRVALAKCYLDKKQLEEAKKELQKVVQACPENLLAQRLLGDAYLQTRESREALHCYRMALLLAPQDVSLNEKVYALEKSVQEGEGSSLLDNFAAVVVAIDKPLLDTPSSSESASVLASLPVIDTAPLIDSPQAFAKPGAIDFSEEAPFEFLSEEEDRLRPADPRTENEINDILGVSPSDDEDDSFRVESVAKIFNEETSAPREITTETLGDLYFSQGQYDKSLRIFQRIQKNRPSARIIQKLERCRRQLGVDEGNLVRRRQIELLQGILARVRSHAS